MSKFTHTLRQASEQVGRTLPWFGVLLTQASVEVHKLEQELAEIKDRLNILEEAIRKSNT